MSHCDIEIAIHDDKTKFTQNQETGRCVEICDYLYCLSGKNGLFIPNDFFFVIEIVKGTKQIDFLFENQ